MAYEAYEIWLTTDYGVRIALLNTFREIQYSMIVNDVGQLSINLPPHFDTSLLLPDYTIQVWRAPLGTSKLALQRLYIIRDWIYQRQNGELLIVVLALDANSLLDRRVIAYKSGLAFTAKADFADDMQRELVNENLIAATDTDRNLDFMTVAPELTAGPAVQLRMSYKNLLSVLKEISGAARAAGTETFFDVHMDAKSAAFSAEFRTKTGQPGYNRTNQGVLFSEEMGNLENAVLEFDYRGEANVMYALGQGSGVSQNIQEVEDTVRSSISRFGRVESTVSASSQQEDDEVTAVGRAALNAGRPARRFGGELKDSRGARYGVDWFFGDRVTVRFLEQEFDAIVRAVSIRISGDGKEEIDARAEYESA